MGRSRKLYSISKLKKSYDVVIIGGGLHGLACAYYLAKDQGIKNVAVLERRYLGFGGSGRNTEVFRANQRAPEILPLYVEAVKLWKGLSQDLDFNIMVWGKGLIGLAHNEAGLNSMRMRYETHAKMGIEEHLLTPEELKKLVPRLNISDRAAIPIVGGYYHPPAGTVRHDAAVWGFAKGCFSLGIDLCVGVEVTGIRLESGKIRGVETTNGFISTPVVLNAAGGYSSEVARLAGLKLPVVTLPLQAMVTEPIAPFLDQVLVSELYFCYFQQSLKGDIVMGAHLDAWQSYRLYNTYEFASEQAYGMCQLLPDLAHLKIMRSWSGLCDMTVDSSPVMGDCEIEGLYLDIGWGYFGFKSAPICGKVIAENIATDRRPELIKHLGIERFWEGCLVPEAYIARS